METLKNFKRISFVLCLMFFCLSPIAVTSHASTITLQWDPDPVPDLAGYKVYYNPDAPSVPFSGTGALQGASPVAVTNQTGATITGLDPSHAYYFAVTAYNSAGAESPYSNIVMVPELVSPTASISAPSNNAQVSGTVSVSANASDNVGVTGVEFYVNDTLQGRDTATPYLFSWNTSALVSGSYLLSVRAYDAAGNMGESDKVSVTVVNDKIAPTVALTAPANNVTVSGMVTVSATAADNVAVTKVELYQNGMLLTAGNLPPFNYAWDTTSVPNGPYNLLAKAYDAAGNVAQSASVNVSVSNGTVAAPVAAVPYSIADAQAALDLVAGTAVPSTEQMMRLDLAPFIAGVSYPNGKIDTGDVIVILQKIVGLL